MPQNEGQRIAAQAVAAELARREWNITDLVQLTSADPGTIGDFLNGSRWPKLGTQGKVEKALGWEAGTIRSISLGGPIPQPEQPTPATPVGAGVDPEVLAELQELSPDEVQRVRDFVRGIRSRG